MKRMLFLTLGAITVVFSSISLSLAQERNWEQLIPLDAVQSDFAALYAGLQSAHADLYVHRSKADYDARYEEMRTSFTKPLTLLQTQVAFQQFTAFGNVAHASIEFPSGAFHAFRKKGGKTFPIFLRISEGRAYVGENYSGHAAINVGDEILSLNGAPIADWLAKMAAHISADTPYIAHSLLEFSFPKYVWLVMGEVPHFEITLRTNDGSRKQVTVKARTHAEQQEEARKLSTAFALDSNERISKMHDNAIAYLRPGPFYNVEDPNALWDNTAFTAFIDASFESYLAAKAKTLIIDLRQNPGGDNSFSDHMVAWIADERFRFYSAFLVRSSDEAAASNQARLDASPGAVEGVSGLFAKKYNEVPRGEMFEFDIPFVEPRKGARFKGEVYVIVNRHSYSNAVNVASVVQDYKFGTIVGEKTSDMATTYGAMETFVLPATGIKVGFPKAHIIRPSGDRNADGVTPDWPIKSPIRPSKKDDMLDALMERLRYEH
jgi:Peptidase family S41